jgi:hypothetical protein
MKAQPDMGFEVPADNADFVPTTAVGHGTLLTGNANSFYVLSRSKRLQHLHSNCRFLRRREVPADVLRPLVRLELWQAGGLFRINANGCTRN